MSNALPSAPGFTWTDLYRLGQDIGRVFQDIQNIQGYIQTHSMLSEQNRIEFETRIKQIETSVGHDAVRLENLMGCIMADLKSMRIGCPHAKTCACPKDMPQQDCPINPMRSTMQQVAEWSLDSMEKTA